MAGEGHVFLSYASADRERALALADGLQAAGVGVWLDRRSIAGGASWSGEIVRGIRGCAALLVLVSPAAMASKNVRQEVQLAFEADRPLVPLILRAAEPPDELRYALAGRQWVEVLERPEGEWVPELLQAVARFGVAVADVIAPDAAALTGVDRAAPRPAAALMHLPTALTSFVGREDEVGEVARLLTSHRLVTLLGPGGTGKTRLAIEAARVAAPAFPDGVRFIPLAAISDPALVLPAVAQALGVREVGGQPLAETLAAGLRERRLLLVLDNLEQVIEAVSHLAILLGACPALTVLATSRVALRVSGEREYAVGPLPLPAGRASSLAALRDNPAVALLVQRAAGARPGFAITEENAATVAAICARLDGLPLALELAAARMKILAPAALLDRLEAPLKLLTGGDRNLPERQQTLHRTIQWSYDLLTPTEQALFRRLSVFVGGCTLEAAEAICDEAGPLEIDVLDGIGSLVEKSLLVQEEGTAGEVRFAMLTTIREFGLEQLASAGELAGARRAHAHVFLAFVRNVAPKVRYARRPMWMERLDSERENVRAALSWSMDAEDGDGTFLGLVAGLGYYWEYRAYLSEERGWLERALLHPLTLRDPAVRSTLLYDAGRVAFHLGDLTSARSLLVESAAHFRAYGDRSSLAEELAVLATLESIAGDSASAQRYAEESLAEIPADGNVSQRGMTLAWLGLSALARDQYAVAAAHLGRSLVTFRESDDESLAALPLRLLGVTALREGDLPRAATLIGESLRCNVGTGEGRAIAGCLAALGGVAAAAGDAARAARLCGATLAMLEHAGASRLPVADAPQWERAGAAARAALGEEAFAVACAAGRALTYEEAVALAEETIASG